jgi:hypothetical protein
LLGALTRLVAWGLHREKAAGALGALLGALGGCLLADAYWPRLIAFVVDSDLAVWRTSMLAYGGLYLEVCTAYLGAVLTTLLLGKRPRVA